MNLRPECGQKGSPKVTGLWPFAKDFLNSYYNSARLAAEQAEICRLATLTKLGLVWLYLYY